MSFFQKFFKAIVSKKLYKDFERDSRLWMVQCPNCNHEKSVWDIGGIRYKAVGNSRWFRVCSHCGKKSWHKLYKRDQV